MFYLALELGKTVGELLSGTPGPMTNKEFIYWRAFFLVRMQLEEKASKSKGKSGRGNERLEDSIEVKKTMGAQ